MEEDRWVEEDGWEDVGGRERGEARRAAHFAFSCSAAVVVSRLFGGHSRERLRVEYERGPFIPLDDNATKF